MHTFSYTESEDCMYLWRDTDDKAIRITSSDENTFFVSEGYREEPNQAASMDNFCYVKQLFEVDNDLDLKMFVDILFRHMI